MAALKDLPLNPRARADSDAAVQMCSGTAGGTILVEPVLLGNGSRLFRTQSVENCSRQQQSLITVKRHQPMP
jgi:hypothetical protein